MGSRRQSGRRQKRTRVTGFGTLRFTPAMPQGNRNASWDGMAVAAIPTFVDIGDVDAVYRLVSELREKKPSPFLK